MKRLLFILSISLLLVGCDNTKKAGDDTAREITGAHMIEQGQQMKSQLKVIEQQQQERFDQLDPQ